MNKWGRVSTAVNEGGARLCSCESPQLARHWLYLTAPQLQHNDIHCLLHVLQHSQFIRELPFPFWMGTGIKNWEFHVSGKLVPMNGLPSRIHF